MRLVWERWKIREVHYALLSWIWVDGKSNLNEVSSLILASSVDPIFGFESKGQMWLWSKRETLKKFIRLTIIFLYVLLMDIFTLRPFLMLLRCYVYYSPEFNSNFRIHTHTAIICRSYFDNWTEITNYRDQISLQLCY